MEKQKGLPGSVILTIFAGILIIASLAAISIYGPKNNRSNTITSPTPTQTSNTTLANPASVFCEKQGGKLVIQKRGDGGEYGICVFEDNYMCEEWALYRNECPKGGVRTTGFDTPDQVYCVILGGQTVATKNSVCTLPSGKKCATIDLYDGKCP